MADVVSKATCCAIGQLVSYKNRKVSSAKGDSPYRMLVNGGINMSEQYPYGIPGSVPNNPPMQQPPVNQYYQQQVQPPVLPRQLFNDAGVNRKSRLALSLILVSMAVNMVTNRLSDQFATVIVIIGVASFACVIAAIVLGFLARSEISRFPGSKGNGAALTAIILGFVMIAFTLVLFFAVLVWM